MALLAVRDLGLSPYLTATKLMLQLVAERIRETIPDTLIFVHHPPVITVGRVKNARQNVLAAGPIPIFAVERGGDVTYHGPEQVVMYPILRLADGERDLHRFLRNLETVIIRAIAPFGIAGERLPGMTGVWAKQRKLASIGIAVRNWVTFHGAAINLAPDPGFKAIRACGSDSSLIGNLQEVSGRVIPRQVIQDALLAAFAEVFQRELACQVGRGQFRRPT
ncbi:MAG: lipoyl(octanoyl) transferase LipB [Cyanobacteria bacterium NC_groundwater_1444_Ag_S-0.65um_54_12]|nr:lipoyl(octanoyl) transferase LipB [Cyanobacteria bacterium NC_groundwater_1444_Ag_S-0.65um_54_12]